MEATYVHNWKTAAGILVLVVRGREVVVWEVLPKDGAEAGGLFCWPGTSMKNAWLYMWPGVGTVYEPGQAECFKHSASLNLPGADTGGPMSDFHLAHYVP